MPIDDTDTTGYALVGYGQKPNGNTDLPTIVPASPTAFELTKYGDIPVNESTGIASVSIPFFKYSLGEISLDVGMSYQATGVKVDQIASWSGMGWNLNAGGVITRTIRGNPDELFNQEYTNNFEDLKALQANDSEAYYKFLYKTAYTEANNADFQPDLYSFNVGGVSGTFILGENKKPILLKKGGQYKITGTITTGFEITDVRGLRYVFGELERNDVRTICTTGGQNTNNPISAIFLSKIIAPNGDEVIFNYKETSYSYVSGYSSSFEKNIGSSFCGNVFTPASPGVRECHMVSNLTTKKLTSITNNRNAHKIVFTSSKGRADLSDNAYKLDKVSMFYGSQLIKAYKLEHEYVVSNKVSFNQRVLNDAFKKRLYLKRIKELATDGQAEGQVHQFVYEAPQDLPPRYSFSQDLLGFYNGQDANRSLLPKQSDPTGQTLNYIYGKRNSDFSKVEKGILKRLVYPTKGVTDFEFEPNTIIETTLNFENKNFGLGVNSSTRKLAKSSVTFKETQGVDARFEVRILNGTDVVHNKMNVVITDKTSNTVIYTKTIGQGVHYSGTLVYQKNHEYEFAIDLMSVKFDEISGTISFNYFEPPVQVEKRNQSGLRIKRVLSKPTEGQEPMIKRYYYNQLSKYKEETVLKTNQQILYEQLNKRLKCEFNPHNVGSIMYLNYKVASGGWNSIYNLSNLQNKYEYVTISIGGDSFENGALEKKFSRVIPRSRYSFGKTGVPNAPYSNDDLFNGTLLEERVFTKKTGGMEKVNEVVYDYELDTSRKYITNGYVGRNWNPEFQIRHVPDGLSLTELKVNTLTMHMSHYFVQSRFQKLLRKRTTNFFKEPESELTTIESYTYNSAHHLFPTTISVDKSDGTKQVQVTYYPPDKARLVGVGQPESTALNRLVALHRIGIPIQVEQFDKNQNGVLVLRSKKRTDFEIIQGNLVAPKVVKISKGASPFENRIEYHHYDSKGNPTEVSKTNGTHVVYIWGYQQKFPVVKIENARLSAIPANYITAIQQASDADFDRTMDTRNAQGVVTAFNGKEGLLRQSLQNLRNLPALQKATMTFYTYDPSVGVTSISDNRGQTVYYDYDAFNRLKFVKDMHGNILKENSYHYKNN